MEEGKAAEWPLRSVQLGGAGATLRKPGVAAPFLYAANPLRADVEPLSLRSAMMAPELEERTSRALSAPASEEADLQARERRIFRRDKLREQALHRLTDGNFKGAIHAAIESVRVMEKKLKTPAEMLPGKCAFVRPIFRTSLPLDSSFFLGSCSEIVAYCVVCLVSRVVVCSDELV
jgi:hypothetical protein